MKIFKKTLLSLLACTMLANFIACSDGDDGSSSGSSSSLPKSVGSDPFKGKEFKEDGYLADTYKFGTDGKVEKVGYLSNLTTTYKYSYNAEKSLLYRLQADWHGLSYDDYIAAMKTKFTYTKAELESLKKKNTSLPIVEYYTISESGDKLSLEEYYDGDISKTLVEFSGSKDSKKIWLSGYELGIDLDDASYLAVPSFSKGVMTAKLYKAKKSTSYFSTNYSFTDEEAGTVKANYSFPTEGAKDEDNVTGTLTFTEVPEALSESFALNEEFTLKF